MKNFGVEITTDKIVKYEPNQKTKDSLRNLSPEKHAYEYIKEFFIHEANFTKAEKLIENAIYNNIPEFVEKDCLVCEKKSEKYEDKACNKYIFQMQLTYLLASQEFVRIVLSNTPIYENKAELLKLTEKFYNCFIVVKKEGKLYFDLEKFSKYALISNISSVSHLIEKSPIFQSLEKINITMDSLTQIEIKNELFNREDFEFIKLQKQFFDSKKEYLHEKIRITKEQKDSKSLKIASTINSRPNRSDIAYFIYYISESKTKYIDNPFPSDAAWQELSEKFGKNSKNIQEAYLKISNNREERLRAKRDKNIDYVIQNMLTPYPKALKLAKDEKKLCELNS